MQIYNTLTREKQDFVPVEPGKVKIYACGPTVYNLIHIGNARPICVFDTLRRYLRFRGYEVTFVQNFTDVDDKIIRRANEEGVTSLDISERYIEEYRKDARGLNVLDADVHPKVTENMDEIIAFVQTLCDKGYAYERNGDVYFRTTHFDQYGKLSHMPLEELEAGARIEVNDIKENPMDFALWKAAKPGEPSWTSPWGEGRPGWHIECSAMVRKYLGTTIDIHCGGQDLVFPHHENEIAQSECANDAPFSNYWMHNGYINVDNKKMSKSLNNFFTTRSVAEVYGYEPIRLLMLQAHYRSQINYTKDVLDSCAAAIERLYNCRDGMERGLQVAPEGAVTAEETARLAEYRNRFIQVMDDDFNTADALACLFELVREVNTALNGQPTKGYIIAAKALFDEMIGVFGLLYERKKDEIPAEVMALVEERQAARAAKDYARADAIRDQITAMGYLVEETKQGPKISKK